jgi:hypothetical protein
MADIGKIAAPICKYFLSPKVHLQMRIDGDECLCCVRSCNRDEDVDPKSAIKLFARSLSSVGIIGLNRPPQRHVFQLAAVTSCARSLPCTTQPIRTGRYLSQIWGGLLIPPPRSAVGDPEPSSDSVSWCPPKPKLPSTRGRRSRAIRRACLGSPKGRVRFEGVF